MVIKCYVKDHRWFFKSHLFIGRTRANDSICKILSEAWQVIINLTLVLDLEAGSLKVMFHVTFLFGAQNKDRYKKKSLFSFHLKKKLILETESFSQEYASYKYSVPVKRINEDVKKVLSCFLVRLTSATFVEMIGMQ